MSTSRRLFLGQSAAAAAFSQQPRRPNILWISCEDSSPQLGCYGDPLAITPNLDKLAAQGTRFTRAYSVIGVCAPSRSSIITGVYPPSLGTQHMRSTAMLPPAVKCFPEFLRNAGYYCSNNAKTDYNFPPPKSAWDELGRKAHWKNRPPNTPFFSVFNLEITHESRILARGEAHRKQTSSLTESQRRDPLKVTVPPYYPDTEEVRRDLANVHDNITQMDHQAGDLLTELDKDGLTEDTIVFFWSDHGVGLPRSKRWLYNSSTQVPLIVRIPERFRAPAQGKPGTVDPQLVSLIDLGPTVLNLASVPIPSYIQSRAFLGSNLTPPRKFVYGARDRMDERYDLVRMITDGRYRFIRNFDSSKPHYQFMNTAEKGPTMMELRRLHNAGKLHPDADRYFSAKPPEELYDTSRDPHEIRNLASSPQHKVILETMRRELTAWQRSIRDLGLLPESEIVALEKKYGNRAAILQHPDSHGLLDKLLALQDATPNQLRQALNHPHPSVRARAAARFATPALLTDSAACVRIAAAQFLAPSNPKALTVLAAELTNPDEWTRLAAAIALDELAETARTMLSTLQSRLHAEENRYVVRVLNHAVNTLTGAANSVE